RRRDGERVDTLPRGSRGRRSRSAWVSSWGETYVPRRRGTRLAPAAPKRSCSVTKNRHAVTYPFAPRLRSSGMSALNELPQSVQASWHVFLETYEPLRPDLYRYCRHLTRSPWDAE